ncbi:MAG: hypothetical protein ONB44_07615 [candidate division KSB1 bacterium]|nr:hypothetical protein [candidate division KSB1 bacterium]MDZ7301994.1 hypothetical protein [candidate division KSB1 bacterium]MDZ7310176.1 hypothetical protein [candidate division KSB1 bacterium]
MVPARPVFDKQMFILFGLIFLTAFTVFAALRFGWDYYFAALSERPKHFLHESFKPSGVIGQGFGVLGGLLCMLTLLYPLRKRWRLLQNFGTPRTWFRFHVYFGIAGPLFATLHSTFKFTGLASICYWSMMIVMASGFIGRFLYSQLPHNQRGVALSLKEINNEISSIQRMLRAAGLGDAEMDLPRRAKGEKNDKRLGKTDWFGIIRMIIKRRRNLHVWKQKLSERGLDALSTRHILALLSRKLFLEGSIATLEMTTRAFSHWHSLHLPFTYIMFITLTIHVAVAIFWGYTWIF